MIEKAILTLDNLSYRYRSDWLLRPTTALHPLTLEVFEGEFFGFLGHNGAGKTTTIKAILSLIKATTGSITIDGISNTDPRCLERVGYLPEQPYFYDYLTVWEVMELYATLAGVPRVTRKHAIEESLTKVKVDHKARVKMRALSKGLTQRVALAQAIVHKPKLLILDEPFSGLDPLGRKEFRSLLLELRRTNTTIFMSSHILQDVEFLCDRASILVRGQLKGVYELKDLDTSTEARYELTVLSTEENKRWLEKKNLPYLDEKRVIVAQLSERGLAEEVLREALCEGISVESFTRRRPSLEEVFVSLVKGEVVNES